MGTLIYDGDCGFCQTSVDWLRTRCGRVEFVASQTVGLELTDRRLAEAALFLAPDGEGSWGADAIAAVLRTSPKSHYVVVGRLMGRGPVNRLSRVVYRVVSANRHRFGRTATCRVPGAGAA